MSAKKVNGQNFNFPFVRGDVFEGLDFYTQPLKVFKKDLVYPLRNVQKVFPNIGWEYSYGMRARLGLYFEILSAAIYGGELNHDRKVEIEDEDRNFVTEPDVTHSKKKIYREVKSVARGNGVLLKDYQMEKYAKYQCNDRLPPIVRFEIFRHGVRDLVKNYKVSELDSLVSELSEKTRFLISIPFSLAYTIYDNCPKNISSRYEEKGYEWYTRFNSTGLNKLLSNPQEIVKELGFDIKDFCFKFRKFPKGVMFNGREISQFPVLIIKETGSYEQWMNLQERVKERHKRPDYDPLGLKHEGLQDKLPILEEDFDPLKD